MRKLVLNSDGFRLESLKTNEANIEQLKVKIHNASLNHRDLWIAKGQYAGIKYPSVLGSDGMGYINERRVLINPSFNWIANSLAQPNDFKILGLPDEGTFQDEITVNKEQVYDVPPHLTDQEAASLPLAGLTAYRALYTRCRTDEKDRVLINGIGGGVALLAAQFALATGCEVWATSGSDEKLQKAQELGISGGVNYKNPDWSKILKEQAGGFDVIIDGAGGASLVGLLNVCNPGAKIGIYGGTSGKIENVSPQAIFWKQVSILGSTMGSSQEFAQMLGFVDYHKIHPIVDSIFDLEDYQKAFDRMESGAQFGKIVLKIAD